MAKHSQGHFHAEYDPCEDIECRLRIYDADTFLVAILAYDNMHDAKLLAAAPAYKAAWALVPDDIQASVMETMRRLDMGWVEESIREETSR